MNQTTATQVLGHTAKSSIARPRELLAINSSARGKRQQKQSRFCCMMIYTLAVTHT